MFASLIQSVKEGSFLITVTHTSTFKVHGRFCHLFILFLKQQIIRSTSSEYNKCIFPLLSILNYYISKVVYNRFIMKSFLPFSAASCNSAFPLLMNAALRRGRVRPVRGRGYPSHLLVLIRGLSRFASAAESDHSEITSSLLSSAVLKWVRPEPSWSQQSAVRSGAGRSGSLRPGPMNWPRCPGTSTPDTG